MQTPNWSRGFLLGCLGLVLGPIAGLTICDLYLKSLRPTGEATIAVSMVGVYLVPAVFAWSIFGGFIGGFLLGAFGKITFGFLYRWVSLLFLQVAKFGKWFASRR